VIGGILAEKFKIQGGETLKGEVSIGGAKNSVLKLLAASILVKGSTKEEAINNPTKHLNTNVFEIKGEDLQYTLSFNAAEIDEDIIEMYDDYYVDYYISSNKTLDSNSEFAKDCHIGGQLPTWTSQWFYIENQDATLYANEPTPVVYGAFGVQLGVRDIWESVETFNCGLSMSNEYLVQNPDFEFTLELRLVNRNDMNDTILVGNSYTITAQDLLARA
jgi:hypothetical protein